MDKQMTLSIKEAREARRRAEAVVEMIDDARRRGYARITRREIEALRALARGTKKDLESCEFGTLWEAHLTVYMDLKRELVKRHYNLAFWTGNKRAQRAIRNQNPWL